MKLVTPLVVVFSALTALGGCVTATVDEMVFNEPSEGIGNAAVAILGRRHASDYDTEPEFIHCVAKHLRTHDKSLNVIEEMDFLNSFYPWFEPRTAPLHPESLQKIIAHRPVAEKLASLGVSYLIWIDGSTVRSGSSGSMSCAVSPAGGGCFGFSTWSNESNYEATIWNFADLAEVGRVNTSATGQSYMPALIVPIPIIAPVRGTACDSIATQLLEFLSSDY